jgi:hypothetical protein
VKLCMLLRYLIITFIMFQCGCICLIFLGNKPLSTTQGQILKLRDKDLKLYTFRHGNQLLQRDLRSLSADRRSLSGKQSPMTMIQFARCQGVVRSILKLKKTKLHGLSPRANYTDRATAACRRSDCQLLRIEGATWLA